MNRENWIQLEEFASITGLQVNSIKSLITEGKINAKYINNTLYIDSISGTNALIKTTQNSLQNTLVAKNIDASFVEQSIGTILSLHDKVIEAKDETIATMKNENSFLKDALAKSQEALNDDRKTIDELKKELDLKKQEIDAINRKYKLMWGKMLNKNMLSE